MIGLTVFFICWLKNDLLCSLFPICHTVSSFHRSMINAKACAARVKMKNQRANCFGESKNFWHAS